MVTQIPLTNGAYALVDDEYAPIVARYTWNVNHKGYARMGIRRKEKRINAVMHRMIWEQAHGAIEEEVQIDHINGNTLDNRLENLRLVTNRENAYNRRKRREGKTTSQFVGVSWKRDERKWYAQIFINGKAHSLGRFTSEIEASKAYQAALEQLKK